MRLSDIKPNPDNPRTATKEDIEKLKNSITELPKMMKLRPIVVDKNNVIVGGNQRYHALQALGKTEIPDEWVARADDFTEEELKRFVVQDNVSSGSWDWDILANQYELEDLDAWGIEVPYADTNEEVEEDEAPEVDESEPPKSKLGEIYQLGRHKVMCADSTVKENVEKLMDGNKADMVFTDPPYNIGYSDMNGKFEKIKNDKMTDGDFRQFLVDALFTEAETYYVCCSWQYSHLFREAMHIIGKPVKAFIVWNKVNPAQNLDKYYKAHEIILYSGKFGGEKTIRSDVWELKRQKNTEHPTMKPIELIAMAIDDTPRAKIVYDGFLGSGSTLIACEQTDRICYGMELDPKYVDVIRKRYWKFTHHNNEEGWEDGTKAINI